LRDDLRVMSTLVPDFGSKIDLRAQRRLIQNLHPAPRPLLGIHFA
jgi:hypothetical protein